MTIKPFNDSIASGESPTAPRRLAFCITDLDPGGAERALVQVVTRLDRQRWQPAVFCLMERGAIADELERADVPVTCFAARRGRGLVTVLRLVRAFHRWRPALLQTWLYHANIAGRVAGRLAGVQRIVSGIRVAEKRGAARLRAERWTEWLVDRHVCVSQSVADFSIHSGGLSPSKTLVIPNGVDFKRFATATPADLAAFGIPAGSTTLLVVGRLDRQKDPGAIVEVMRTLSGSVPRLHALFVGDGPLRFELEERIRGEGLTGRVHLAGWQPDVAGLMRAADLLVLPSLWEGMPNVVLEAMATGLPVIATQVEGVEELLGNSRGLIVPPGHVEHLAQAVRHCLCEPEAATSRAIASQVFIRERFTWSSVAKHYQNFYEHLLTHA